MPTFGKKSFVGGMFRAHIRFEKGPDDSVIARTHVNGQDFEHTAEDEFTAGRELKQMLRDKVLSRDL